MSRKSTIDKLDPKLKAECDRLISEGAFTLDELLVHLQSLGAQIKRTALGDYKQRTEKSLARYREAQAVAGSWVKDLGEAPDSKTGQLLAELLKTCAFRTLADMQDQESGAEPEELALLARALKDMAGAQKTDLEFRSKLQAQWKAELAERAKETATAVAHQARSEGLTQEAADRIQQLVFGLVS